MKYQKPKRRFERTGFVNPEKSYYVQIEDVKNADNDDMKTMVDKSRYFSIFAPRQSGKTTFFKAFARDLEQDSKYIFILLSFENFSKLNEKDFYNAVQKELYPQLIQRLKTIKCPQSDTVCNFLKSYELLNSISFINLFRELNNIIKLKKIVIFIDEFDGIPVSEIGGFLTTLRKLYQEYKDKKEKALYSVGIVGIRDVSKLSVDGVSPFNIADHIEIPAFTLKNISDLYNQYTHETNQPFSKEAVQQVFKETGGQPWLVNRLASIATGNKADTVEPITVEDINQAVKILLKENNDHFKNLSEKLNLYKTAFYNIVQNDVEYDPEDYNQSWLKQYGLIKHIDDNAKVANEIYKKRFFKLELTQSDQSKPMVFLCYAKEDISHVRDVYEKLKNANITPCLIMNI